MSLVTEAARTRAQAAKYENATPHLVSELVTHIEKLIEEIEHGNQNRPGAQGSTAQETGHSAGSENSNIEAGDGEKEQVSGAA